ncbi:SH3 domain-containing protein [Campylobacter sp.]|uniref:SH3 domain-containing protein n=1 Tax=Campylobacter sp. TaxID=205 RepID=UPI0026DBFFFA|nr:SH3 domain-containing protein [Campylobacter sp.]MDO4674488.1 SH3 domain-containing protein [Campylobacter sp.]
MFFLGILTLLQAEDPLRALNLPEQTQKFYQNVAPSDELDDFEKERSDPFVSRGDLALELEDYADKFYVGEVFALELHAKTTEETNFDFQISPLKNEDLLFLNPNPKWDKVNGGYKSTLWFEAKSPNANLDQIIVELLRNNKAFEKASINVADLRFESPPSAPNFSHLVASSLEVKKVKTSHFNDKDVIMMLELDVKNANLKSFFMQGMQRQGIENLKGDFNASTGFYYAIFPAHKNEFSFSYFNKESKKLENFKLKLQISDNEISTQSDLNPTSKSYNLYKQYALWALALILAALFVWKKGYFILASALLSFALGFLMDTNTQSATLKSGARVQILPTENSTLFHTAESSQRVEILAKRGRYTKILLNDGKIGWAHHADLRKD